MSIRKLARCINISFLTTSFVFYFVMLFFSIISFSSFAQITFSLQDFETTPATPTMGYTNTGGTIYSGSSGTGDRPASTPFYSAGARAIGVSNGTSTFTFANQTSLDVCTSKYFEFKLAAFSIASTGNGMDAADLIRVEISLDGGTTWSNELRVLGNSNAYWNYSASGLATVTYDGNNTATDFSPAGGGSRTTDGYSTIRVNLPNACTQARIRITLTNNDTSERWVIDNVKLIGTCPNITTGAVTGGPFTVGCLTDDAGVVAFTSFGTFDIENNYSVELSNSVGSFASPIIIGTLASNSNSGNINVTIPPGMSTSGTYRVRVVSSNPSLIGTESAAISITLSGGPCNTITTGALSAASYTLSCTAGTNGSVDFTSTGTFIAGNTYSAQLSDAVGNFGSPLIIGSLNSTSNSGTINFALPSGLSGTNYKIRVVSSNPGYIGSETSVFTISLTGGPCGPLFLETFNEAANSTSGTDNVGGVAWTATCPNSVDANDYNKVESSSLRTRDSNGPARFTTGSINISSCSESFYIKMDIQAIGDMEQCAASPADNAIDFVSLEYRLNGGAWTGAPSSYNCGATDGFNSTAVIYDVNGNGSTTYNSGCIPTGTGLELRITSQNWASDEYWVIDNVEVGCISCILLPISLTQFSAACSENNEIEFKWETASESNNNYFTIEKTTDGINFESIAKIEGAGNSYTTKKYNYKLINQRNSNYYFRLKQTDYNGNSTNSNLISPNCEENTELMVYPNPSNGTFIVNGYPKNSLLIVTNDLGQSILKQETDTYSSYLDLSSFADGIYLLQVVSPTESQTIKLILSK